MGKGSKNRNSEKQGSDGQHRAVQRAYLFDASTTVEGDNDSRHGSSSSSSTSASPASAMKAAATTTTATTAAATTKATTTTATTTAGAQVEHKHQADQGQSHDRPPFALSMSTDVMPLSSHKHNHPPPSPPLRAQSMYERTHAHLRPDRRSSGGESRNMLQAARNAARNVTRGFSALQPVSVPPPSSLLFFLLFLLLLLLLPPSPRSSSSLLLLLLFLVSLFSL